MPWAAPPENVPHYQAPAVALHRVEQGLVTGVVDTADAGLGDELAEPFGHVTTQVAEFSVEHLAKDPVACR